jgi:hypothetical protein
MGEPLSRIDLADPSGIDVVFSRDTVLQFAVEKPPLDIGDIFFTEFFHRTHVLVSWA